MEKTLHVRLSEDIYKILEKEAKKTDRKISSMARYILIQWSKKDKENV